MSEYFYVVGLSEKKLSNGKNVLLVRLEDGGLGASYFALIDPKRGEVFFRAQTEIIEIKGDRVKLGYYKEEDWEELYTKRGESAAKNLTAIPEKTSIKPTKMETYDLKKIVRNKVIFNKNSFEAEAEVKYREVKIYLWRANDEEANKNFVLGSVMRTAPANAPLRETLEQLFTWNNETEQNKGFSSPTFGMKFEGVVLNRGIATIKFSQPKDETNYGSLGPFIFLDALEKTTKQFPTVKKVVVCAIGETLIDAQMEKPFPRCK